MLSKVFNVPFMQDSQSQATYSSSKTNRNILLTNRGTFGLFMSKVLES